MADKLPPLPPGFTVDQDEITPPLPPGFSLDAPAESSPSFLSRVGQAVADIGTKTVNRLEDIGNTRRGVLGGLLPGQSIPGNTVAEKIVSILTSLPGNEMFAPVGGASEALSAAVGTPPEQAKQYGDLAETLTAIGFPMIPTGPSKWARRLSPVGIGRPNAATRALNAQEAMRGAFPSTAPAKIPLTIGEMFETLPDAEKFRLNNLAPPEGVPVTPPLTPKQRAILKAKMEQEAAAVNAARVAERAEAARLREGGMPVQTPRSPGAEALNRRVGEAETARLQAEIRARVESEAAARDAQRRLLNQAPPAGIPTAPPMTAQQRAILQAKLEAEAQAVNASRAAEQANEQTRQANEQTRQRQALNLGPPPEVPVTPQASPGRSVIGPTAEMNPDAILLQKMRDAAEGRLPVPPSRTGSTGPTKTQAPSAPTIPPELQAVADGKASAFLIPPAAEGTIPTVGEQALAGQDMAAVARRLKLSLFTGRDGTKVLYRAKTVPRETLTTLDKEGRLADIVNGPGTSPKPDNPTKAVVVSNPKTDTEIRTVLTDTPEKTASAVTAQPASAQVEVKPASEVGGVIEARMQGIAETLDDARNGMPTGKQWYPDHEGNITGTGNAGALLPRFRELFPEIGEFTDLTAGKVVDAIKKDKNNPTFLRIKDAVTHQMAKEAADPAAVSTRPDDFADFERFSNAFDEVVNTPDPILQQAQATTAASRATEQAYKAAEQQVVRGGGTGEQPITLPVKPANKRRGVVSRLKTLLSKQQADRDAETAAQQRLNDQQYDENYGRYSESLLKRTVHSPESLYDDTKEMARLYDLEPPTLEEYTAALDRTFDKGANPSDVMRTLLEERYNPNVAQVEQSELLSGLKAHEPTRQAEMPLGEAPNTVEFGMGLPIPKSMKDRLRRLFGPEGQEQGLRAHGGNTATTIFNRVLGTDEKGVPFGERFQELLKEIDIRQGRGDAIVQPLNLHALSEAENLAVKQALNEGRTVPLTARARQAVEAWKAYRTEAAATAKQRKVEVRRDAIYTAPGGEQISGTTWKPFEAAANYYPNAPDWRKIAAIDPAQFRRLLLREHRDLSVQQVTELVDGYKAQAAGKPLPRHISDEASRIIRGGEPSASFLHERRFRLPSEVLADLGDVFPRYIEETAREFAIAKVAGPRGKLFEDAIAVAHKTGNKDALLAQQQWDALTHRNIADQASQSVGRVGRVLGNAAVAMWIGPSTATRQLSQVGMAAAELPLRSFAKGLKAALTKAGWTDAKQFGAMIDAVWQDMQMQKRYGESLHPAATLGEKIEHGSQRMASAVVKSSGVTFMDSFGRVLAYNGALDDLSRAQQLAKRGNAKAIDYLATRRLTATSSLDDIKTAASRVSDEINLRADPSTVPVFLYKPGFQSAMRTLNSFDYAMTAKVLRNYITPLGRAVAAGDLRATGEALKKVSKYAVTMGIAGEFIGDTIREIQGRRTDRPGGAPEDFARDLVNGTVPWKVVGKRLATDLVDASAIGMVLAIKEALLAQGGKGEATSRMLGKVVGAGVSNVAELAYHAGNVAKTIGQTEKGPRGGKSPWERATGEATRALGRRIPVAGSFVAGTMSRSEAADRRIYEADIVRARNRKDIKEEMRLRRELKARTGENISPTRLRKAQQAYNQ